MSDVRPCLGEILYSSFQSYLLGEIRVGRQEAPEVCYVGHECRNREAGALKFTASGLTLRCIRLLWNICNDRSSLFRSVAEDLQAKTGYCRPSSNSVMFLQILHNQALDPRNQGYTSTSSIYLIWSLSDVTQRKFLVPDMYNHAKSKYIMIIELSYPCCINEQ